MKTLCKIIFIFCLISIPTYGSSIVLSETTISSNAHLIWRGLDKNDQRPYHAGYFAELTLSQKINPSLNISIPFRFFNPSFSSGYQSQQQLSSGIQIVSKQDLLGYSSMIKVGDLNKVTVGNGLTFENFEAEGFQFKSSYLLGTLYFDYLAHGLTYDEDIAIITFKNSDFLNGYILTDTTDFLFSIIGYFGKIPLSNNFQINYESAYAYSKNDIKGTPLAIKFSPKYMLNSPGTKILLEASARLYTASFTKSIHDHGRKTKPIRRYGIYLNKEDEAYDSWYHYIINDQSVENTTFGISVRIKIEHALTDFLNIYGDYEFVHQNFDIQSLNKTFYSIGLKQILSSNHYIYEGISNKTLVNNDPVTNSYSPLFTNTPAFFVVGLKVNF